jgi:hypothetical protein
MSESLGRRRLSDVPFPEAFPEQAEAMAKVEDFEGKADAVLEAAEEVKDTIKHVPDAPLSWGVIDDFGNAAIGLSADGRTAFLPGFQLILQPDGGALIRRPDGAGGILLSPDGSVAGGGLTTRQAAGSGYAWALVDDAGFSPIRVREDGAVGLNALGVASDGAGGWVLQSPNGSTVLRGFADGSVSVPGNAGIGGATSFSYDHPDFAWAICDTSGFVALGVKKDGTIVAPSLQASIGQVSTFSAAEIRAASTRALAMGSVLRGTMALEVATADADYNLILIYGQSLSTGQESWPALSTSIPSDLGLYMLGSSEHAQSGGTTSTTWVPIGSPVLTPLKATVKNNSGGLLTDAEVAALAPGAQNLGESPGIAAAIVARRMWLAARGLKADPAHKWVVGNCGISGRTIEQLSYGASPNLFNRMPDFVARVKAIADAEGKTVKVAGIIFLGNEYNYDPAYGGATDRAGYLAKLEQLRADILSQVCQGVLGQSDPPAFVTYQTGAQFTRDAANMSVGMAQLDFADGRPTSVFLGSPHYHVTDKGGHLDPNGSRWLGCPLGRALGEALVLRHAPIPLRPLEVLKRGREILVTFTGRRGKLVWRDAYSWNGATMVASNFAAKGFALLDGAGALTVSTVEIVGDCAVRITAARDPVGTVTVRYAGQATYAGSGNLFDDDPPVYPLNYVYAEGTGQYPAANIPALVGKPYPANNPCVAFQADAVAV